MAPSTVSTFATWSYHSINSHADGTSQSSSIFLLSKWKTEVDEGITKEEFLCTHSFQPRPTDYVFRHSNQVMEKCLALRLKEIHGVIITMDADDYGSISHVTEYVRPDSERAHTERFRHYAHLGEARLTAHSYLWSLSQTGSAPSRYCQTKDVGKLSMIAPVRQFLRIDKSVHFSRCSEYLLGYRCTFSPLTLYKLLK